MQRKKETIKLRPHTVSSIVKHFKSSHSQTLWKCYQHSSHIRVLHMHWFRFKIEIYEWNLYLIFCPLGLHICHSRGVANFLLAQLPMNDWSESVSSQKGLTRQVGTCCALQPSSTFLRLFYYKMKTKNPSFLSRVSMMGRNDKGEPSWKKQGSSLNNTTHPRASILLEEFF